MMDHSVIGLIARVVERADAPSDWQIAACEVASDEIEQGVETIHAITWRHYVVLVIEGDDGRIVSSGGRLRNVDNLRRHAVDGLHLSRMRAGNRIREGGR